MAPEKERNFCLIYLSTFSGLKAWHFYPKSVRWRHDNVQTFLNMSEVFQKHSERIPVPIWGCVLLSTTSFPMFFLSKLYDFGESIVIYSFYTEFSFLKLVPIYIFLESMPVMVEITNIFQLGVRNLFCMYELAWVRSFQLTGVRLTPKATG